VAAVSKLTEGMPCSHLKVNERLGIRGIMTCLSLNIHKAAGHFDNNPKVILNSCGRNSWSRLYADEYHLVN